VTHGFDGECIKPVRECPECMRAWLDRRLTYDGFDHTVGAQWWNWFDHDDDTYLGNTHGPLPTPHEETCSAWRGGACDCGGRG
jgi:hypothetical protein